MLGHLMDFMGFHGSFWRENITPNGTACPLIVILGDFLGLCRANVGPFWVYVGPMLGHLMGFMGFHGSFWRGKKPNGTACPLRVILGDFLGLCRANVGPFWVYVGPMLGHLVGFMGFHGGFWKEKITPNRTACPLRVILGDFLGLCRANVGPFWVYVGPMLGHWMGFMGFHGSFWREKIPPNGTACPLKLLMVILGDFLGLCRANVGPMLGQCWVIW